MLPRPRLLRRLIQARDHGPIFLIAPPGYGKTILLREYAAHQPNTYLIRLHPESLESMRLEDRLAEIPPGATILMDDIQHLAEDATCQSVVQAALARAEHHWLLAGRNLPRELTPKQAEIQIFGSQDLAFTESETHYLLESLIQGLDEGSRAGWYRKTQGWPLAVTLAQYQPESRAASHFQTEGRADHSIRVEPELWVIGQMARQMLAELPPELAEYLCLSALSQRTHHALTSYLLGCTRAEAATHQAEIIRRNLFLYADEEPGWYRYHDLIREFLQLEARERWGEARVSAWLTQIANWYLQSGDHFAAIEHALAAQNMPLAGELIEALALNTVWAKGLFRTYQRWIEQLDEEILHSRPTLLIRLGRSLLQVGERATARALFNRALSHAAARADLSAVWLAQTALAKLCNMEGELDVALALCETVIREAPVTHPAHLEALNASGNAYTQLNRFQAARNRFDQALALLTLSTDDPTSDSMDDPNGADAQDTSQNRAQMVANLHHNLAVGVHIPQGRFEAAQRHLRVNDAYYAERPVARSLHLLAWCGFHEGYGDWSALAQDLVEIEAAEAQSEYPDEEDIWYLWFKALYHTGMGEFEVAQNLIARLSPMVVTDEDRLCLDYAQVWLYRRRAMHSVSRETLARALETASVGPLYRGMLALESLLLKLPPIGGGNLNHFADGQETDPAPPASVEVEYLPLHTENIPSVDPVPGDLAGLFQVRSAHWLLRLDAFLAYATLHRLGDGDIDFNLQAGPVRRALRRRNRVLQKTEQKFFWRVLIYREPELGLRFWIACLISAGARAEQTASAQQISAEQHGGGINLPIEDATGKIARRSLAALHELITCQNGLNRVQVLQEYQYLLEHAFSFVRQYATRLLATIGDETTISSLVTRLEREADAGVRIALEQALDALEQTPPPMLHISLLGEFQVVRGERLLEAQDWHRPAVRRLFQYFALHAGQLLSRDRILDDLWPESAPDTARNTFRTLFSWLRRALDPHLRPKAPARYFLVSGETYCFAPDAVRGYIRSDMALFEETVRAALAQAEQDDLSQVSPQLLHVLEQWSPLLPELPYEPWAVTARERVGGLYVEGCLHAAQNLLNLRREAEAAQWAARAIEIAPWFEEAYQTLMRAYARLDRRSLALRIYADCANALARELDVSPSTLTEWLAQRLRQGEEI